MSWDIFVQDLPPDIRRIEEIPSDFMPKPIGMRADIIAAITEVAPGANFSDPTWGRIEGSGYSIEVNLGEKEVLDGFALHIHGGSEEVSKIVIKILSKLGLRGMDPSAEEILMPECDASEGFRRWKAYRDKVIGQEE